MRSLRSQGIGHRMLSKQTIMQNAPEILTDPTFVKRAYSPLDKLFLQLIRDERDLPFIYFILKIFLLLIPFAIVLYCHLLTGWNWWGAAIFYLVCNFAFFIGRFALMFHCAAHRPLFKRQYNRFNLVLPYLIAPFFGHMADTYYAHHIGMHHAENNLEDDESSTMFYQRDSFRNFLLYLFKFLIAGITTCVQYFKARNRTKLMRSAAQGQVLIVGFCCALCFVNLPATICVFICPYFFYRLIAMLGNWAQHAFIDSEDPGNAYGNSITCINSKYNWQCWNDGYHISHHLKQTMHWTEHPVYFQHTIQKYGANNAVVFANIDFMQVSLFLLCKRYDLLAKNFVNIGGRFTSDEEVAAFLKKRACRLERV